ncbi:hypothetical protein TPR58_10810 [Sphingomonas sp. HF-S3]|uniref:Uncharacterized protein n=1 Tax=Sphingomonas rustica TaxID=3103142 RepID=A0ABV0B9V5_9SPHN
MKLTINSIYCKKTCSATQPDNVFLIIQADGGPPIHYPAVGWINMKAQEYMTLPEGGYSFDFDYGFVVTAWDADSVFLKGLDSPDFLFNFDGCTTSPGYYSQTLYNNNGAEYCYDRTISS